MRYVAVKCADVGMLDGVQDPADPTLPYVIAIQRTAQVSLQDDLNRLTEQIQGASIDLILKD
jgi:hypothetical protein